MTHAGAQRWWNAVLMAILALAIAACAPGSAPAGTTGADQSAQPPAAISRVTLANGLEVGNLATKLQLSGGNDQDYLLMSNSPLVVLDARGAPVPRLAAELPARDRGSWVVNADGTMVTTWKIRPNAVWHDGQPVTAQDFVFALRVYLDEAIPVRERRPERFIDRIEPVDATTFTIRWKVSYAAADRLLSGEMEPLPEHLLASLYDGDKEAFVNAPFWSTTAHVGAGPYRLVDWDKGVRLIYRAFDGYFLGRPKLDEVIFHVVTDVSTVPALLLSGAVDATVSFILSQEAAQAVKQQWSRTGEGQVISYPVFFRAPQFQLHPDRTKQPALLDVRVRRAVAHGVDRAGLVEAILGDPTLVADTMVPPASPLYPRVQEAITTYPFNLERSLALLQEAGWTKRGDQLVDTNGQRFSLDIQGSNRGSNIAELGIIAANLRSLGMQVSESPISTAQAQSPEASASFPGLAITSAAIDIPRGMGRLTSAECRTAQNHFTGNNTGCWLNPKYDRLFQIASTALDDGQRADAIVEFLKVQTAELPVFGDFFLPENMAVPTGLVGPTPRWPSQSGHTWSIHEWYWER